MGPCRLWPIFRQLIWGCWPLLCWANSKVILRNPSKVARFYPLLGIKKLTSFLFQRVALPSWLVGSTRSAFGPHWGLCLRPCYRLMLHARHLTPWHISWICPCCQYTVYVICSWLAICVELSKHTLVRPWLGQIDEQKSPIFFGKFGNHS